HDMSAPAKNSLQQGRAEGYLFGDIGSLIGNTISAIPGVDNKTIGQAFTTAGDFSHLATFLFTNGLSKMGTPAGIALQDLEQAQSELGSNPSGAWHLANAVIQ